MHDPESVVDNPNPKLPALIGETAILGSETHQVGAHDGFSIPVEEHGSAAIYGGEVVAKLSLGGHEDPDSDYKPQNIDILHIRWTGDSSYQHLVRQALKEKHRSSDMVMLALGENGRPMAAAFLQPRHTYNIGRVGNVGWFKLDAQFLTPEGWTPFEENHSISREQITLMRDKDALGVYGRSENSKTKLTARSAKPLHVVRPQG